jgi:UDPglucose--hexose-1-phosphate uridylyltransferase
VPPSIERALTVQREYHAKHERGPLTQLIADELDAGVRMLHTGEHAVAFVPACARWAYEIWVAPRRAVPTLVELTDAERHSFALALSIALRKLDGLWQRPMPYVLSVQQAPARGEHPGAHVHIEIYPWARMPGRLKYLAGSEVGVGAFTADTLPEAKAAELRAVVVPDEHVP